MAALASYAPQISALWKWAHFADGPAEMSDLRVDLDRFGPGLERAAGRFQAAHGRQADLAGQQRDLEEREALDPLNPNLGDERATLLQERVEVQKRIKKAVADVLRAVAPKGFAFSSTEDYEQRWESYVQAQEEGREEKRAADESIRRARDGELDSEVDDPSAENERLRKRIASLRARVNSQRDELQQVREDLEQANSNFAAMAPYASAGLGPGSRSAGHAPDSFSTVEEAWHFASDRWSSQLAFGADVARGVRGLAPRPALPRR